MRNNKGVSLVSLVITIVVLIMLTGIALNTIVGSGSILKNAENSVKQYNNNKEDEEISNLNKEFVEYIDGVTAKEVAGNPTNYYGKEVINYTVQKGADTSVKWKIFYADGEDVQEENRHIYLIADDYIHGDYALKGKGGSTITKNTDYKLSFNNIIEDYKDGVESILNTNITDSRVRRWYTYANTNITKSDDTAIMAIAYMLDTKAWDIYKNVTYADYAIGGPTLEMLVASYNQTHSEINLAYSYDEVGYYIGTGGNSSGSSVVYGLDKNDKLYILYPSDKALSLWIASQSNTNYKSTIINLRINGLIRVNYNDYITPGLRPIVCLKSDVKLLDMGDNKLRLI